jgi:trans-aconitate methyltransferase
MASPLAALLASDGLAAEYETDERWVEFVEHVVETLDVGPGTSVFDVGCGAGAFLFPLSQNGYLIGGTDPSAERIARAAATMPEGRFRIGRPADVDPADAWDVVMASRGFAGCDSRDDVRALLARMVAKATHAIAVLRIEENAATLDRTAVLRLLAEIGVSAVQFEDTADGHLHVFARV